MIKMKFIYNKTIFKINTNWERERERDEGSEWEHVGETRFSKVFELRSTTIQWEISIFDL